MFKKFKDKLAEEMKQSPLRLQAGMQQLAQAVVSPSVSNSSIHDISSSNDNFSLAEEDTPKNSPEKTGFHNIDLMSPISNSVESSRYTSVHNNTGDAASLFPVYESPANIYHLQSDIEQSTSEIDDNISAQLDGVSKERLYKAYQKMQAKYNKYRGRFTDLAKHYRELERANGKLESVLVETQDKVLRRIADLKEQCQLEQQAKAHLEEVLRNDIEEKDHIINTLNTKIKLLKLNGSSNENLTKDETISEKQKNSEKDEERIDLIDLSQESSNISENSDLLSENESLKEKLKKLETVLLKYKDSLKRNKEKFFEMVHEKDKIQQEYNNFRESSIEEVETLKNQLKISEDEIKNYADKVIAMKKREEESAISLAENKLSIHRELEEKEEQIKKLSCEIKQILESNETLNETVNNYKIELKNKSSLQEKQNALNHKNSAELSELHRENESYKMTISDLENNLHKSNDTINLLKKEKTYLTQNIINYKESISKLKENCGHLKNHMLNDLPDLYYPLSNLSQLINNSLANFEEENKIFKAHIKEANDKLSYSEQNKTMLEQKLSKTIEHEALLEKELILYKDEVKDMQMKIQQYDELSLQNDKLIAEIDNLNFKVHDFDRLQTEIIEMQRQITAYKETVKTSKVAAKNNEELENEIQKNREVIKSLQEKLDTLQKKYSEALINIESLKGEHSDSTSTHQEFEELKAHNIILQEEITMTYNQIDELNKNLDKEKNLLAAMKAESQNQSCIIEQYTNDIMKLNEQYKILENEHSSAKITLEYSNETIQKLTNTIGIMEKEQNEKIQEITKVVDSYKNQRELVEKELISAKNEIARLTNEIQEIESLRNEITNMTSELKQLKATEEELHLENKHLKNRENEILKSNEDFSKIHSVLNEKIKLLEEEKQHLIEKIETLQNENSLNESQLNDQQSKLQSMNRQVEEIDNLQVKINSLNTTIENYTKNQRELTEENDNLLKINEKLQNQVSELQADLVEMNEERKKNEMLHKELDASSNDLNVIQEENHKLHSEINELKQRITDIEKLNSHATENLYSKSHELEAANVQILELKSNIVDLENKIIELKNFKHENIELKNIINSLNEEKVLIEKSLSSIDEDKNLKLSEILELRYALEEKIKELQVLDVQNTKLLQEMENMTIEKCKDITEKKNEIEVLKHSLAKLENQVVSQQSEITSLKIIEKELQSNLEQINTEKQDVNENIIKQNEELLEVKKKLEAQLDEALITFQAKETQMQAVNTELKDFIEKLREEAKTNEKEQSMRLKQLVKEFQAQLQDKEEELQAALEKRFDSQQNYESDLIHQYKEQLKDYQIELTTKSEQIESLITEKNEVTSNLQKEIEHLSNVLIEIKNEHANEVKEIEKKWKIAIQQKTEKLKAEHEQEFNEMNKEWQKERKTDDISLISPELESTSRVAMAAIESNTGSFHTLQQTLTSQRRELDELRKLVKLKHENLEDSTEIEYLRNILFEYMMGKETMVLARVIAAVVKFDSDQTNKILKKEEDKLTLLGSLGLS